MEIKDLQYFLTVADAGSLSAASERLFLSQQGLSSAILRLEAELGYPLLNRSRAGVTLTERGRAFYEKARPVVSNFMDFTRDVTAESGRPSIAIACAYNIVPKCPRPMQRLLLNQDSEYAVETTEHFFTECEELLEGGRCSFAIEYGPVDGTQFTVHPLFSLKQCFIANRQHPLAKLGEIQWKQLENELLIIPHKRSRSNAVIRQICRENGFEPHVVLECDRSMEVLSLVKRNPEVAGRMFEQDVCALNDPDIVVLHFTDVDFCTDVCLIERKRQTLSHTEKKIKKAILDCVRFAEEAGETGGPV